jgi:hypothetical protein
MGRDDARDGGNGDPPDPPDPPKRALMPGWKS